MRFPFPIRVFLVSVPFIACAWCYYCIFVVPALQVHAARSWTPTPCVIAYSGSPGQLQLQCSYTFAGHDYISHRFQFGVINYASGGHGSMAYPAKVKAPEPWASTCYVDPIHPEQAVVMRTLDSTTKSSGAILVLFMLITGGPAAWIIWGWVVNSDQSMPDDSRDR